MIKTIELDDQNFDMIVENARKAIRKYAPYWTDENAHDPGITLIELFAWLKEMQQFYMDQTTEPIEIQFLKLLGQQRTPRQPAALCAQMIAVDNAVKLKPQTLASAGRFDFETFEETTIEPVKISDLQVDYDGKKRSVYQLIKNGLTLYPFGNEATVGSSLYVSFDPPLPAGHRYMFYLRLYDSDGVKRNPLDKDGLFYPLSDIRWQGTSDGIEWVTLPLDRDDSYGMIQSGIFALSIPDSLFQGRGCIELRATLLRSEYDYPPRIADLFNRVVEFRQVRTYEGPEFLFSSTGMPYQTFNLPFEEIVESSLVVETYEKQPDGSRQWMLWYQVDPGLLDVANEDNRFYCVENNGQSIRFGNGRHGKIPDKGPSSIRLVTFEQSFFHRGNLIPDLIVNEGLGLTFKCLTPASGGTKMQTLEDLKLRVLNDLHKPEVAVTAEDYEWMLSHVPGLMIKKVKCLPLYKPGLTNYPDQLADNTVSVFVIPQGPQKMNQLNPAYLKNLQNYMETRRLVTTEVFILDPVYYEVSIYCEVASSRHGETALSSARDILTKMDDFEFGQSVTKSILIQALRQCPDIDYIQSIDLTCTKPINKNRLGDLLIPANGIAVLSHIEVVLIRE